MTDEARPIQEVQAEDIIGLLDGCPPPRYLWPDRVVVTALGSRMMMFSTAASNLPDGFTERVLDGGAGTDELRDAVIDGLREYGQRVGPFRSRKITAIMGMLVHDQA